jgi:hypothetical protein
MFSTDLESYEVSLSASDDEDEITKGTVIIVKDVNRNPVLTNASPASQFITHVGSPITFYADAYDPDGDNLTYTWQFNSYQKYKGIQKIRRIWTTPGDKIVKAYIDDGYTAIVKKWKVKVLPKEEVKVPEESKIMLTETYIIESDESSAES